IPSERRARGKARCSRQSRARKPCPSTPAARQLSPCHDHTEFELLKHHHRAMPTEPTCAPRIQFLEPEVTSLRPGMATAAANRQQRTAGDRTKRGAAMRMILIGAVAAMALGVVAAIALRSLQAPSYS